MGAQFSNAAAWRMTFCANERKGACGRYSSKEEQ